jgi:hypothetical protein
VGVKEWQIVKEFLKAECSTLLFIYYQAYGVLLYKESIKKK